MSKIFMAITSMYSGGAERVMATLANGLSSSHEVSLMTMTSGESFYKLNDEVNLQQLGSDLSKGNFLVAKFSKLKSFIRYAFNLRKEIKKQQPDAIIAFMGPAVKSVLLLKFFMRLKCKVIVSERADPTVRSGFERWLERAFFPKADVVVCQSKRVVEFFKKKDREKCVVIPNPICADAIPQIHIGERKKNIVAVGRLEHQKNFSMLIRAFSRLPKEFDDYKLEIYGGGSEEKMLNNLISDLGVADRASLMGIKKNVMFEIADASLFVMSSDFEGFPNALVEAMATGLPVISTDFSTGVAKDIIHDENGIIIPVGDEDALLEAMIDILSDVEKMRRMSVENRKYLDIFSEKIVIDIWKETI